MREHLYKAKNLYNDNWVFGFYALNSVGIDIIISNEHPYITYKVDPETVCEYTGWDFNGEKAFEGDTVVSNYGNGVIKFGIYNAFDNEDDFQGIYPTIGFFIQYDNGETVLPDIDNLDYFTITGSIYDKKDDKND